MEDVHFTSWPTLRSFSVERTDLLISAIFRKLRLFELGREDDNESSLGTVGGELNEPLPYYGILKHKHHIRSRLGPRALLVLVSD